jgi:hypothetical protein
MNLDTIIDNSAIKITVYNLSLTKTAHLIGWIYPYRGFELYGFI